MTYLKIKFAINVLHQNAEERNIQKMMIWIIFLGSGMMLNSIKFRVLLTAKEKWFKVVYKRHIFYLN